MSQETQDGGSTQASFNPPVVTTTTDSSHAFAVAVAVFAKPLTLFGVVAGEGANVGDGEYPYLGYEATLNAFRGGGTFSGFLPEDYGGPDLRVGVTQVGASATLKAKPFDPRANGYFGLLFYGRGSMDVQQMRNTTTLGSAVMTSLLVGFGAGALVEGRVGSMVEVMAFLGCRTLIYQPMIDDIPRTTTTSPEYGGNVAVHLPYDLTMTLGSLFSIMKQGREKSQMKMFNLGLIWTPSSGIVPVVDGGTP